MASKQEKSALKRARVGSGAGDHISNTNADQTAQGSTGETNDSKKPRRSARISGAPENGDAVSNLKQGHLPSPVTRKESTATTDDAKNGVETGTASPPNNGRHTPQSSSPPQKVSGLSSPPGDTQPFSQFVTPAPISYEVEDEEAEGVWGYLIPITGFTKPLVLKKRAACPIPATTVGQTDGRSRVPKKKFKQDEEKYEEQKQLKGIPAGGYLIGRHPECDRIIKNPTVSNRHCLFFSENKDGHSIAVLEDLSGNGTYVNDGYVGRNKRRELQDGDDISILDQARFIFRYPRVNDSSAFKQHYNIQGQLGKGHFATVYLATEKNSGTRYAVKKFEKRSGPGERSKVDGLQQEIAVLMGVSHPNMLCLKDTFDESDGVYLVLELAPEGELFNWIVMKQKLSEVETRKIFVQLFQGVKYLHERNIVHRDIKPENILLTDKNLSIKLADFGLAKIIGEESFTTTLCGTPSYVAPEILESSNRRRYTRAVDVWSLGVVLYICLCGFPPFSDELYSQENPYTLSQQIKMGRFDYPSPYWDSVGDPALDLIDRMLTVDVEKRISIDECLEHPWITQRSIGVNDSTDGLTGALSQLDFTRRKPHRERTLLSSINDVKIDRVMDSHNEDAPPVKVFDKNQGPQFVMQKKNGEKVKAKPGQAEKTMAVEPSPAAGRNPDEFLEMGGKGDEVLYPGGGESRYPDDEIKAGAPAEGE